ncbi:MAG: hypothetical protein EAX90_11155 [Candidatus Heimdallarchaeota archaeon]|nr:hypothetical protein [Candidatus Heimdallarchaeota archaeon]
MNTNLTKDEELYLEEYKMVNDLLKEESGLFWTRFNVILAVEVFLFYACAFLIKELGVLFGEDTTYLEPWLFLTLIGMCIIIGIVTTIIWFTITEKGAGLILYLAQRLLYLEKKIPLIKKQTDMRDVFYKDFDEKDSDFAKEFHPKLRKSQKKSITGNVRYLVLLFLLIWFVMIPLFFYIVFSNWIISTIIAGVLGIIVIIIALRAGINHYKITKSYQK